MPPAKPKKIRHYIFKCRRCGETFTTAGATVNLNTQKPKLDLPPVLHDCEHGSPLRGLADVVGLTPDPMYT